MFSISRRRGRGRARFQLPVDVRAKPIKWFSPPPLNRSPLKAQFPKGTVFGTSQITTPDYNEVYKSTNYSQISTKSFRTIADVSRTTMQQRPTAVTQTFMQRFLGNTANDSVFGEPNMDSSRDILSRAFPEMNIFKKPALKRPKYGQEKEDEDEKGEKEVEKDEEQDDGSLRRMKYVKVTLPSPDSLFGRKRRAAARRDSKKPTVEEQVAETIRMGEFLLSQSAKIQRHAPSDAWYSDLKGMGIEVNAKKCDLVLSDSWLKLP